MTKTVPVCDASQSKAECNTKKVETEGLLNSSESSDRSSFIESDNSIVSISPSNGTKVATGADFSKMCQNDKSPNVLSSGGEDKVDSSLIPEKSKNNDGEVSGALCGIMNTENESSISESHSDNDIDGNAKVNSDSLSSSPNDVSDNATSLDQTSKIENSNMFDKTVPTPMISVGIIQSGYGGQNEVNAAVEPPVQSNAVLKTSETEDAGIRNARKRRAPTSPINVELTFEFTPETEMTVRANIARLCQMGGEFLGEVDDEAETVDNQEHKKE